MGVYLRYTVVNRDLFTQRSKKLSVKNIFSKNQ